jgi:hypothetical protein
MAQLFSPRANTVVRSVLVAAGAFVVFLPIAVWAFFRTPIATGQYSTPPQPIPFSHPLHVNGLRIDCRYCHAGAERASMAGLPPTKACVPCHTDGLLRSTLFTPVRQSLSSGRPIMWQRVNRLPDFVFFNHAVHVRKGMGCETCHGPVHLMQSVYQAAPLTMDWCVDCHRQPERYLGSAAGDMRRLTSCTTCHR